MVKSIRALDRGLTVLELLNQHSKATLADLHAMTELPRASLLRLLKTMEERDWIFYSDREEAYTLGSRSIYPISRIQPDHKDLASLAAPILGNLCRRFLWPCGVAVRSGRSMLILESLRQNSPFVIDRNVVGHHPRLLTTATGRAYLAFCPDQEREQLLVSLRKSAHPDDKGAHASNWVERALRDTRKRGYGVREVDRRKLRRREAAFNAIAVPVMHSDTVIACVNMLWIDGVMSVERFAQAYLSGLQEAAGSLSSAIRRHRAAQHRS